MPLGVGIDLGTTHCATAVYMNEEITVIPQENGKDFLPSTVSFAPNGILIGHIAEDRTIVDPKNTISGVKRIIGRRFDDPQLQKYISGVSYDVESVDGNPKIAVVYKHERRLYDPEYITALILKKLKEKTEIILGHKVNDVVITVPAFFNDSQRQATKDAGSLAGLNVLQILNEPTAAAIAYGIHKNSKNQKYVLIYQFGSGMFDVSVLKVKNSNCFETQSTAGDTNLGGVDIDDVLVDYCANLFYKNHKKDIRNNFQALQRLRLACTRAKLNLSSAKETGFVIHTGIDGIDFSLKISRSKFEELCDDIFNKTIELLHEVIVHSGISKKDIDDVVLSGGCSKIPKVKQLISDYFGGKYIDQSFNASVAVTYGAAVRAAFLTGYKDRKIKDMLCIDVTPLSIGIETLGGIMTIVIERGTPIPMTATYTITTETDNQRGVRIRVFEGERALTCNNHLLGTLELLSLPPMPRGVPRIEVTFEIDSNGILTVSAKEKSGMEFENMVLRLDKGRLSRAAIDRMLKEASDFDELDEIERNRFRYRKALEQYVHIICRSAFIDTKNRISDRDKLEINKVCNKTREWLEANPTADVQAIIEKRKEAIKFLQPYARRLDLSVVSRDDIGYVSDACNSSEKDALHTEKQEFSK